jgi:hypothetical protein
MSHMDINLEDFVKAFKDITQFKFIQRICHPEEWKGNKQLSE